MAGLVDRSSFAAEGATQACIPAQTRKSRCGSHAQVCPLARSREEAESCEPAGVTVHCSVPGEGERAYYYSAGQFPASEVSLRAYKCSLAPTQGPLRLSLVRASSPAHEGTTCLLYTFFLYNFTYLLSTVALLQARTQKTEISQANPSPAQNQGC